MARGSKIVVQVKRSKNFSSTTVRASGIYGALVTNTVNIDTASLPLFTTSSEKAYWLAVLAEITAQVTALP
jgi:hypothetical protein